MGKYPHFRPNAGSGATTASTAAMTSFAKLKHEKVVPPVVLLAWSVKRIPTVRAERVEIGPTFQSVAVLCRTRKANHRV